MWFLTFCYLTPPIWQTVYWNNCEMIYFLVMFKVFISVFIFAVRPLLFLVGSCHFTKVGVYLLKTKRLLFLIKLIMSITDKNFHFQSYFRLFLLRRVLFLQIIHRRQKKKKKKAEERAIPGLGIKTFQNIWQRSWNFIWIFAAVSPSQPLNQIWNDLFLLAVVVLVLSSSKSKVITPTMGELSFSPTQALTWVLLPSSGQWVPTATQRVL